MPTDPRDRRAYNRAWRHANPDKAQAQRARYRAKHPEEFRAGVRRWYALNREKRREYEYRKKYGLSVAEAEAQLAAQGHCCPICKAVLRLGKGKQGGFVDHCHESGEFRGILCMRCNAGLGLFKHNPAFLRAAANYLKKP